jgi:GTP cyclohydrolase I
MTTRGVHMPDTDLVTSRVLGCFRDNPLTRQEFLTMEGWRVIDRSPFLPSETTN